MQESLIHAFNEIMEDWLGPPTPKQGTGMLVSAASHNKIPSKGKLIPMYEKDDTPRKTYLLMRVMITYEYAPLKLIVSTHAASGEWRPSPVVKIISKEKKNSFITKDNRFLLWITIYGRTDRKKIHMLAGGTWYRKPLSDFVEETEYPYTLFECEVPKPRKIGRSNTARWNATFALVTKAVIVVDGGRNYYSTWKYKSVALAKKRSKKGPKTSTALSVRGNVMWYERVENPRDRPFPTARECPPSEKRTTRPEKKHLSEDMPLLSTKQKEE